MIKIFKPIIFILLLSICKFSFSQEIENLESIYQSILDDKYYIKEIETIASYSSISNDTVMRLFALNKDSTFELTFKSKRIYRCKKFDENSYLILNFNLFKNKRRFSLCVTTTKHFDSKNKAIAKYTCYLKKKKGVNVIKKPKITHYFMCLKYL